MNDPDHLDDVFALTLEDRPTVAFSSGGKQAASDGWSRMVEYEYDYPCSPQASPQVKSAELCNLIGSLRLLISLKLSCLSKRAENTEKECKCLPATRNAARRRSWRELCAPLLRVVRGAQADSSLLLVPHQWLEVKDRKHRYGSNLKEYFEAWKSRCGPGSSFFDWLDSGEGRELDLEHRPRARLNREHVRYCNSNERSAYEVVIVDGLLRYNRSGYPVSTLQADPGVLHAFKPKGSCEHAIAIPQPARGARRNTDATCHRASTSAPGRLECWPWRLDALALSDVLGEVADVARKHHRVQSALASGIASSGPSFSRSGDPDASAPLVHKATGKPEKADKWIYVWDMQYRLYVGRKVTGRFHHSSFVGGGAVRAAGSLTVANGRLAELTTWSGHYRPDPKAMDALVDWLEEQGVDMKGVSKHVHKPHKANQAKHAAPAP